MPLWSAAVRLADSGESSDEPELDAAFVWLRYTHVMRHLVDIGSHAEKEVIQ